MCSIELVCLIFLSVLVFRDTILLAREYELFSPLLAFNVVDNVILLHQRQASVAVLLDVASASSEPIGSPLPLVTVKSPPAQAPSAEDAEASTEKDIKKFTARWKFFLPNIVIDEVGNVYKTQVCVCILQFSSACKLCKHNSILVYRY